MKDAMYNTLEDTKIKLCSLPAITYETLFHLSIDTLVTPANT